MNKPPAFQFYPKDFIADGNVAVMNMEERGVYITLLSYCWLEGWLPNASTKLKRMCNNPSNWEQSWNNIKHCFYEKEGKLYHKRLDKERQKQQEWREKSRIGGVRSGETRRKKSKSNHPSTTLQPPYEPNANQTRTLQSSSSSSSSNKNKYIYVKDQWNEFAKKHGFPPIRKLNTSRKGKINARLNEKDFNIQELFKKIEEQPFLFGENKDGWVVNFDMALSSSGYLKIMEMSYLKRKKKNTTPSKDLIERLKKEEKEDVF